MTADSTTAATGGSPPALDSKVEVRLDDRPTGVAPVKAEFRKGRPTGKVGILLAPKPEVEDAAEEDKLYNEGNSEVSVKRERDEGADDDDSPATAGPPTKRGRGQNKNRSRAPIKDEIKLCKEIAAGNECSFGVNCKHSHDVEAYLAAKGPDLGTECPVYSLFGKCKYGYKCRFAGAHMTPDGKLTEDTAKVAAVSEKEIFKNIIDVDFQRKFRGRKLQTPKSDRYARFVEAAKILREYNVAFEVAQGRERKAAGLVETMPEGNIGEGVGSDVVDLTSEPAAVDLTNEPPVEALPINYPKKNEKYLKAEKVLEEFEYDPISLRFKCDRSRKKTIDFRGKTYLAPLTTVGNLPFRRVCKGLGVDITCGEMAMAQNLMQGQRHEWTLTRRHASEDIFGVQIAGNSVQIITKACEVLKDSGMEIDFVDLNLGCPVDAITRMGAGSALMDNRGKLLDIIGGAHYTLDDIPITVKFRNGIFSNKPIARKLVPKFIECGASLLTLHGRSKEQRYTKLADWDYIAQCAADARNTCAQLNIPQVPFFGNGDVLSSQDYWNHLDQANIDGALIGRGALIKPWIFTEVKERRVWDISSRERLDILKDFAKFGLEYWGSDTQGVNTTRRFMCEWLSFLYRYIPVGLLEVLPQRINDRPPAYFGRDELETLMASPNSKDWVKISEMLLGKAPDSFSFIPKHRSNAYETDDFEG
ncbi:zinc finger dihydrouridine synthase [Fimicolochytrium jonesii]|uniref:zinc finger dihydrouridine synthase n=1 Tax=Fimicolochytrium jonesii TaxID=1396493 RepID=UPI0022FEE9D8|nr:zinc finger dihydrouridine synthase [Fimicolochytrium jonesii]KAI8820524.1 zinc finger dihydrouridine synthase [Fimicolochytrium jonesii]